MMSVNLSVWKYMEFLTEVSGRLTVLLMIGIYMWQWQSFLKLRSFQLDNPSDEMSEDMTIFMFWITLEILLLLAINFSNFVFLSIRSCFKVQIEVHTPFYEEHRQEID